MSLIINEIISHTPISEDKTHFVVNAVFDGSLMEGLVHSVPSPFTFADSVCLAWLEAGNNTLTEASPNLILESRRAERKGVFSETLDVMNPLWYEGLSVQEKADVSTWRQEWLDYPSTGVVPNSTLVDNIF
jgi:hypothetical protein